MSWTHYLISDERRKWNAFKQKNIYHLACESCSFTCLSMEMANAHMTINPDHEFFPVHPFEDVA